MECLPVGRLFNCKEYQRSNRQDKLGTLLPENGCLTFAANALAGDPAG